ncbi:MAG: oligosaccharide flippase family protein [Blastocatellia bacterium]|nr:oligosaccharide flippase family protein [Blastocatellia bacterium]MCS7156513.1 oligosaccharide flippase family protein [Blastocatellia bacterium]MDW8256433.1 oligosaccharide flippase family protein [Acidobacteriota bacterium]
MRSSLTEKAVIGAIALAVGQMALLAIQLASSVFLARRLGPTEFGTFAVLMFVVSLAHVLSEFGQGTVLVQRPAAVEENEWRTSFTLQFMGAAGLSLLLLALASSLARIFDLGGDFTRALAWLGVPMVMMAPVERLSNVVLERRMAYGALSAISIVGGVLYAGVAVSLAWKGFGLWSLVGGTFAASLGRTLLSASLARWPISVGIERESLVALWRSGFPCQRTDFFGFLREHTPPLIAGPIFGTTAVGYLVWARNLTYAGYHVFAAALMRVGFSLVARLSESQEERSPSIGRVIEGMTFALTSLMTVLLALLLGLAQPVITVIYTEKWMPALPALYLFGIRMIGSALLGLFVFFANGMGLFSIASRSVAAWSVLEMGVAVVLASHWGFYGIAAASAFAVWAPTFWLVQQLRSSARAERVRFWEALGKPVFVGGIVGGLLYEISPRVTDLPALLAATALGAAIYVFALWWWSNIFREFVRNLWARWWSLAKVLSSVMPRNAHLR